MLALIDADIVLHRVGYTTDNDPEWIARARCNEMVEGILADTNASEYQLWLSDSRTNNFRYKLWDGYKANRKDQKRPVHYDYIKELLIKEWDAQIAYEQEADDALGINQDPFTVICSIDKDLKQVPGKHYNFVTKTWDEVTPTEGLRKFYTQLLTGDTTDNIRGCYGIGPKKAEKILESCFAGTNSLVEIEQSAFSAVYEVYERTNDSVPTEELLQTVLLNGRLLKIRTKEDELWHFPQSELCQEIWQ